MINSKYFRVPKKKEPLQENEVHVTSRQEPINFIRYAIFLFEKRNLPYIKFKASGSAIASLVNIAEILKKVIPGIHQVNRLFTLKYEQDYEPKEKGLDHVTITRNVPVLEITFSKVLLENDDVNHYGYQPAINPEVFERVKINVGKKFLKIKIFLNIIIYLNKFKFYSKFNQKKNFRWSTERWKLCV
jgi:DNA-binding protein